MLKGVSPLIAAVLLIVFTVAIGAVVLNWMTEYTKGTTEKAGTDTSTTVECAKQILDIVDVKIDNDGNVTVFLQNLGSADARITTVTLYDDAGNICNANTSFTGVTVSAGGMVVFTPITTCTSVNKSAYTLRVASDCGSSDVYKYPSE